MASQLKYDSSTMTLLESYGINESAINQIIYDPILNSAKFVTWDGNQFCKINELPDDHKTRKNIILTRKITHNLDSNNPNVSSEFQTYIFLT